MEPPLHVRICRIMSSTVHCTSECKINYMFSNHVILLFQLMYIQKLMSETLRALRLESGTTVSDNRTYRVGQKNERRSCCILAAANLLLSYLVELSKDTFVYRHFRKVFSLCTSFSLYFESIATNGQICMQGSPLKRPTRFNGQNCSCETGGF